MAGPHPAAREAGALPSRNDGSSAACPVARVGLGKQRERERALLLSPCSPAPRKKTSGDNGAAGAGGRKRRSDGLLSCCLHERWGREVKDPFSYLMSLAMD